MIWSIVNCNGEFRLIEEAQDAQICHEIKSASELLNIYFQTETDSPLYPILCQLRDIYLKDIYQLDDEKEIKGLILWLLIEAGIDNRGETLEQTAERLSELDMDYDDNDYSKLIWHLRDASERLDDL